MLIAKRKFDGDGDEEQKNDGEKKARVMVPSFLDLHKHKPVNVENLQAIQAFVQELDPVFCHIKHQNTFASKDTSRKFPEVSIWSPYAKISPQAILCLQRKGKRFPFSTWLRSNIASIKSYERAMFMPDLKEAQQYPSYLNLYSSEYAQKQTYQNSLAWLDDLKITTSQRDILNEYLRHTGEIWTWIQIRKLLINQLQQSKGYPTGKNGKIKFDNPQTKFVAHRLRVHSTRELEGLRSSLEFLLEIELGKDAFRQFSANIKEDSYFTEYEPRDWILDPTDEVTSKDDTTFKRFAALFLDFLDRMLDVLKSKHHTNQHFEAYCKWSKRWLSKL